MPIIAYEAPSMRPDALAIVEQANAICREYSLAGYSMTLRQTYYQFVARGLTAEWPTGVNTERSYKRLGSILDKARMQGLMDWNYISDRTRSVAGNSHWDDPGEIVRGAAGGYRIDKWTDQRNRVEVWVEKEALADVIGQVASERDCDYFACRGYVSSSAMWRNARRIERYLRAGQDVTVLHLGDHDPSGIDMTRDIRDRLDTFVRHDLGWVAANRLDVHRIALTMEQVEQYDPPPNPAKLTDSRSNDYVSNYGDSSWELDALPPNVLTDLINDHISALVDPDAFARRQELESTDRARLALLADNWDDIAEHVDTVYGQGSRED